MNWMRRIKLEHVALIAILIFIASFIYVSSNGVHEWSGADAEAEDVISELTGGSYEPWFQSIYRPPSGEIESLLFALQAGVGSLIIGYFLGYYRAVARMRGREAAKEPEGKSDA